MTTSSSRVCSPGPLAPTRGPFSAPGVAKSQLVRASLPRPLTGKRSARSLRHARVQGPLKSETENNPSVGVNTELERCIIPLSAPINNWVFAIKDPI